MDYQALRFVVAVAVVAVIAAGLLLNGKLLFIMFILSISLLERVEILAILHLIWSQLDSGFVADLGISGFRCNKSCLISLGFQVGAPPSPLLV